METAIEQVENPLELREQSRRTPQKLRRKRSGFDRRLGEDRRRAYNLDYFLEGGQERRRKERRQQLYERRAGWVKVSKWSSVFSGDL
ncbi:MAG: hypothetical protein JSW39_24880 [Desulfobacterales bacterium]|nr:MAG: hypothetical protein JSW39_24880 [Desulfobacterales bacterium]